jgi:hypothetical protein
MPFTEGYGIGSLKPGVCTSTTRPASPYNGQVIYETDTDKTLVYNGTGWVFLSTSTANPVGLVYITQATPSAVSSVSINNCFTSAYENYRIVVNISSWAVADGNIGLRLRAGGTDTTTNYLSQRHGGVSGTSFGSANVLGTDEMYFGSYISAAPRGCFAAHDILAPQITSQTVMRGSLGWLDAVNGNSVATVWNAQTSATSYDGFTLIGTQSFTGTVRVYGYLNS